LEGAPCLATAVDRRVSVKVVSNHRQNHHSLKLSHANIGPIRFVNCSFESDRIKGLASYQSDQLRSIRDILRSTRTFGSDNSSQSQAIDIEIDAGHLFSDDGTNYGFGSIAAITVALQAMDAHFRGEQPINLEKLLDRSIKIHRTLQLGRGSGIDTAVSTYGGIIEFQTHPSPKNGIPNVLEVAPLPGLHIGAVWSGRSTSTSRFLTELAQFKKQRPDMYETIMARLMETSRIGIAAFREKQIGRFLMAVNRYYRQLVDLSIHSDLPIVSPVHQQLALIAFSHTSVYKPSGAGGGDMGLFFTTSSRQMRRLTKSYQAAGFKVFDVMLGAAGVGLSSWKRI
jgi:phosphomevalonate kinase